MSDDPLAERILPIACPKCGEKTEKTLGWLKANDRVVCAACGSDIRYDPHQLIELLERNAKMREDVARQLNRRVTLKLKL